MLTVQVCNSHSLSSTRLHKAVPGCCSCVLTIFGASSHECGRHRWQLIQVCCSQLSPLLAGALLYYNATVALPVSLSLIKDRLEQSYYRQTEGFLGDVDTLASNAKDFNGVDSPVGIAAAGILHTH